MFKGFNRDEILSRKMKERVYEEWNLGMAREEVKKNGVKTHPQFGMVDEEYLSVYVGSLLGINPSGKYGTFWTTNQTTFEKAKDSFYWEILDTYADENGVWFEQGEGDPLDTYLCCQS